LDEDGTHQRFDFTFDGRPIAEYLVQGERPAALQGSLFNDAFNYLNAERVGPRLLYPIGGDERWPYDVGIQGEYVAAILGRFRDENIANTISDAPEVSAPAPAFDPDAPIDPAAPEQPLDMAPEPTPRFLPLQTEVIRWMQEIIPGFDLQADILPQTDQAFIRMKAGSARELVRPSNIGFGLIYTLPIVVAALVAPPGSMLIVENPEAHLHPRGQSAIGRFLARVATANVQVVVETHSDHVLNGIRVAVREGAWGRRIAADDVSIQFFAPADDTGPQRVITPRLYPSGGIAPRPEGFFDQIDKDLMELL
jgi:predicted ATPase